MACLRGRGQHKRTAAVSLLYDKIRWPGKEGGPGIMRCTDQWAGVGVHGARHVAYGKDVFCSVRNRTWGVLGDKIPMEQVDIPWHAVYFLLEMVRKFRILAHLTVCCNSAC